MNKMSYQPIQSIEEYEEMLIENEDKNFTLISNICVVLMVAVIITTLTVLLTAFNVAEANQDQDFYTVINGQIYATPIPDDCPGCTVTFVKVHVQDRWIELKTDRISKDGFE